MHSTQFAPNTNILVNPRQKGNGVLKLVKNVGLLFEQEGLPADFHINQDTGCLFLSMKYHMMNPRYITQRLDGMLGYSQKIVLLHSDSEGADDEAVELSCVCIAKGATLVLAFSAFECARYLETLKLYERRSADLIKGEQESKVHEDVFRDVLTSVRSINSSDASQLGTTFGTLPALAEASTEELLLCPGLGAKKADQLRSALDGRL